MAVDTILDYISPGQTGTINQGGEHWREVRCERIIDGSVILAVIPGKGEGHISLVSMTHLQIVIEGGLLRVEGELRNLESRESGASYIFTPHEQPVRIVNRREFFRVAVALKGRLKGTTEDKHDTYDNEWEMLIRDLSVGGVKGLVKSPPPYPRTHAIIRIVPETEGKPLIIPCKVIQSMSHRSSPPHDSIVRLAFDVNPRLESVLNRYVTWVQLELLKKGVR